MTIKPGDKLPQVTFRVVTQDMPEAKTTDDIFSGRKILLFAVPGAFTPTCHRNHLPGYIENLDAILAKGVDAVAVTSVNDAFVMQAWARESGALGKITFLADGAADFARAAGLDMDRTDIGFGVRSKRYAMLVDNGIVTTLQVDDGGKLNLSSAEAMLASL